MTNKEKFINEIDHLLENSTFSFSDGANVFFKELKKGKANTGFTENGKNIIQYLQGLAEDSVTSAKDIGSALSLSGRSISGSMRKLVSDGYVIKQGKDPVLYSITAEGRALNVD